MKKEELYEVIGNVSEKHIAAADVRGGTRRYRWIKWGSLAAGCAVVLLTALSVPSLFTHSGIPPAYTETKETDTTVADTQKQGAETTRNSGHSGETDTSVGTEPSGGAEVIISERYVYGIPEGKFSSYVSGKVIEADKIGERMEETVVQGGWQNRDGKWLTTEELRAEIYSIQGISADIAVALKFIDKGDALTTTHYYVILNPDADQTPVAEYIIPPLVPNLPGDEMGGAVPE